MRAWHARELRNRVFWLMIAYAREEDERARAGPRERLTVPQLEWLDIPSFLLERQKELF